MKREEILMLVCAFLLGFFLNAILKSSCMGKLYEGYELQGCTATNIMQILADPTTDVLERSHLERLGCEEGVINSIMNDYGPSN